MVKKNQKDKRKTEFCLFCAPKTPEALLVSETRKETGFCGFARPANMPRTTQKPGICLAFAKTHPKHFWHFTIKRKSTRSVPIVSLSRSCTPRQPSYKKKKEINVVASKKAPEHQDMDTHVFAAFAATKKHQTHHEVDFRVSPKRKHHAHPKSGFVYVLRSLCTRNTPKMFLFCVFAPKVTEHANTVSVFARLRLENFLMSDVQGPSADGSRHAAQV